MKVLVVEDDAQDRRLLDISLEEAGARFTLLEAGDLASAMRLVEEQEPQVVLLDLGLPDSNGLTTLRRFRTAHPDVPVVVLTGTLDPAIGLEAIRQGADHYLVKGRRSGDEIVRVIEHAHQGRAGAGPERGVTSLFQDDALADLLARRVEEAKGAGNTVVVATVHAPAHVLKETLPEENVYYIDATGHGHLHRSESVTVVDSPQNLEAMAMRLQRLCQRHGPDVVGIVFTLDAFRLYASEDTIAELVHALINRFQYAGIDLELIALADSTMADRVRPLVG